MLGFTFIISAAVCFTLLSAAVLATLFKKEIAYSNRLDRYLGQSHPLEKKKGKERANWWKPIFNRYWQTGIKLVEKRTEKKAQLKLEILLRDAGYSRLSAIEFRLIQLTISVGAGFFIFLLMASAAGFQAWLIVMAVSFLGFRYPIFYLAKKKTQRIKTINRDMADFFDMVNLLLEAGTGLDAAIANVCRRKNGPIVEEFKLVLDEMKRGKSRREAFYNLKKRVPSDAFQSVLSSIIQADQLGIGMAKVIRNLTVRIREQRREAAREQAMKAPVKMLIPMVVFIFPALFIVILGPMVLILVTKGLGG